MLENKVLIKQKYVKERKKLTIIVHFFLCTLSIFAVQHTNLKLVGHLKSMIAFTNYKIHQKIIRRQVGEQSEIKGQQRVNVSTEGI